VNYYKVVTKELTSKSQDSTYETLQKPFGGVGVPTSSTEWVVASPLDKQDFLKHLVNICGADIRDITPIGEKAIPPEVWEELK